MIAGALNLTHEEFSTIVAPTVLSSVACVGSEVNLSDCPHSDLGVCGQLNDAGAICQGMNPCLHRYCRSTLHIYKYLFITTSLHETLSYELGNDTPAYILLHRRKSTVAYIGIKTVGVHPSLFSPHRTRDNVGRLSDRSSETSQLHH